MALEHTPLDPALLGPAVQRALAPGPARMMAARGLAPLPRPGDLISVLYQLALDSDPAVARAAADSARALPDRVLEGALVDPEVDPRVLDYYAPLVRAHPDLLQRLILNPTTADATIAELAGQVGAAHVDLIAQNEQRLLRHPDIVGAMFHNPEARMSTVDRAMELAARNGLRVPGIPSWDVLVSSIMGSGKRSEKEAADVDALFSSATGGEIVEVADDDPDGPEGTDKVPISQMTIPQKIRLATLGNSFARGVLIRDPNRLVAAAAIKAPGVTDVEAAKYAGNHSLADDVIKYIASKREWTKGYGVKLSLVLNPKTAIPDAIRLMPHIREKDLRNIARSRGIPSAVVAQARKLLAARSKTGRGRR